MRFFLSWTVYFFICFFFAVIFFNSLESDNFQKILPKVNITTAGKIKPGDEVAISFSYPVRKRLIEESLKLTPEVKGDIVWNKNATGLRFVPKEAMQSGQKYMIAFQGKTKFFMPFKVAKALEVEEAPEVVRTAPFKNQGIETNEKIFIIFDKSTQDYQVDFKIEPNIAFEVASDDEKEEFVLTPQEELKLNQEYKVEVYLGYLFQGQEANREKVEEFSFSTVYPLNVVASSPQNGVIDVSPSQKVTVSFDKPISLAGVENFIEVNPGHSFKLESSVNKKTIVLNFTSLKEDTTYNIYFKKGLLAEDGSYLEAEHKIYFKTGNKGGIVLDKRRSTEDPFIKDGKYIDVNLSTQLLGIYTDGVNLGTYRISSGKRGMGTPIGSYAVLRKEKKHWSNKYKLWMPYSLQFTGAGHFIHELPEWPNGYKEGANHLGIPVSHGCVRLGVGPAEMVFNFADVRTPLYIHY